MSLDSWFFIFHQRFKVCFSNKTIKDLEMRRSTGVNNTLVNNYINDTNNIFRKFKIPYKCFFNIDETRMSINDQNHNQKAFVLNIKHIHHYIILDNGKTVIFIPIITMNSIFSHH